jgi:hypothetical protein
LSEEGQMNMYLNYLRENETMEGEAEPVGLILCTEKDEAVVHYALGGLTNKVFASRYNMIKTSRKFLTDRRTYRRFHTFGKKREARMSLRSSKAADRVNCSW